MKILKSYASEELLNGSYGTNSPLLKEIKANFDIDEVVLAPDYTEEEYAELIRKYDVLMTMWGSVHVPNELATNPGNLKYICNITGEMRKWIDEDIIASPYLKVTNWGDAPAFGVAEGAFSLMMAVMKDMPLAIQHAQNNGISAHPERQMTSLFNIRIGIYGMGVIGRKFVDFCRPFAPKIFAFDPYVDNMPEGVTKVNSLEELFDNTQILVIHAGLSPETEGAITGELLAKLPDGGIVINTARGKIIDNDALMAELEKGRLRAGLDVMSPEDWPPVGHPCRQWRNLIMTGHFVSGPTWGVDPNALDITSRICLDNLTRYKNGEPLKFVMDVERYRKST